MRDEIDAVLPCLDEAAALPWVLARMPPGFRAIVADNGSTDGSGAVARSLGALVVDVPQRGFGAAVHAGLLAARTDVVCVLDADGSLDPAELPAVAGPVLRGEADLVLGRRRPTGRGAWPWHGRVGNAVLARRLRRHTGAELHDLGPMRAFRRQPLLACRSGTAASVIRSRWCCGPPRPTGGSPRWTSATGRGPRAPGPRSPARSAVRPGRSATWPRCFAVSARLLVLAKAPVPGRVKTRLCPPCTPDQAAAIAAAALADTLAATTGAAPGRTVLALDGPDGRSARRRRPGPARR